MTCCGGRRCSAVTARAARDVDDHPDVALRGRAERAACGRHNLPSDGPARARAGRDGDRVLGRHATPADADYLTAQPVHATPTNSIRLGLVRSAAEQVERPWFAMVGVDAWNLDEVVEAGATPRRRRAGGHRGRGSGEGRTRLDQRSDDVAAAWVVRWVRRLDPDR